MNLPEDERAALAASLFESLDAEVDDEAPFAWDAEIARRVMELRTGAVKAVPWPEAWRRILGSPDGAPKC